MKGMRGMNNQSKKMRTFVLGGLLLAVSSLSATANELHSEAPVQDTQSTSIANGMHPEVPILDAQGTPVVESGLPMSTMATCGGDCHETSYIMSSSDHADAGASQLGVGENAHGWQQG
jgi:hypothetical protein